MKILSLLVGLLWMNFAPHAVASPMADFKTQLSQPYQAPFPLFVVTWDEDSDEARKLFSSDINKYFVMRKLKASEHERFVRRLTKNPDIRYDDLGFRNDKVDLQTITITPKDWLLQVCNYKELDSIKWARWGLVKDFPAREPALAAFDELLRASAEHAAQTPSVELSNFIKEATLAKKNLLEILDLKFVVENQRNLRGFLDKWAK